MAVVCAEQMTQQENNEQNQEDKADKYEHSPAYEYSYHVQDNLTGDNKQQQESRRGNDVRGQYSLIDADG